MAKSREQMRTETLAAIKAAAHARLAVDGANLSLRAVARDVGLVSSAVYRYFPNRDALLTALIIDTYNDLGECVEAAEAKVRRDDFHGRFRAYARAIRTWALANPHEYALVHGSPVPGYEAPQDTIEPANRSTVVFGQIVADAWAAGAVEEPDDRVSRAFARDLAAVAQVPPFGDMPRTLLARGIGAWSAVFGLVSSELFHAYGPLEAPEALFDHQVDGLARTLGLPRARGRASRRSASDT